MSDRRPPAVVHLGPLLEREPPTAHEAEVALLGAMMQAPDKVADVEAVLKVDDLYRTRHRVIFAEVTRMIREGGGDLVELHGRMKNSGTLEGAGGLESLIEIFEACPGSSNIMRHAEMIREAAVKRRLATAAGEILHAAYADDTPAAEQVERAQQRVFDLSIKVNASAGVSLGKLLDDDLECITQVREEGPGVLDGVPSGLAEIDKMLTAGGARPGQLVVVGARPSIGKSAFGLHWAANAAARGHRVVVFSLEMSGKQVARRVLASSSGLPSEFLDRPDLHMGRDDWDRLNRGHAESRGLPFTFYDCPGLTVERLASEVRREVPHRGAKLVVVDYLQIMATPRGTSPNDDVADLTRRVKQLAGELHVPIILLSQVN